MRPPFTTFYNGDKPALASGPDPAVKSRDDLYVAYDDFSATTDDLRDITEKKVPTTPRPSERSRRAANCFLSRTTR